MSPFNMKKEEVDEEKNISKTAGDVRKYKIKQLHPGPLYLAIYSAHGDSCKHIFLFCFSHIKHILKFKPLQRSKVFYLESRINLIDFFVKYKYTKTIFLM